MNLINCTAPWITKNKQFWCKKRLVKSEETDFAERYLASVIYGHNTDKDKECLKPCKSVG